LFIFDILVELLTQTIDKFYTAIKICYSSLSNKINLSKGENPIIDILIWMMINDPAFLFYHPERNDKVWGGIEMKIIDLLWTDISTKEKEGGGKGIKRPHTIRETELKTIDNNFNLRKHIKPIRYINQPYNKEEEEGESEHFDINKFYIDDDDYDNFESETENKRQNTNDGIDYSEYVTNDECLFMKCAFDKEKIKGGFNKHDVINRKNKDFSLADYHKKYYKPYYNIYYKN